ncbi:hypothetical protein BKA65DRAFT_165739 [Rhexocercosporidium sp. MPI-PUGE-AT-0058]|nr:hypothetical protein BKA65DRAFT_165739 [Rhexocercosporidium sp. MPI-PUGE-AT-0058]
MHPPGSVLFVQITCHWQWSTPGPTTRDSPAFSLWHSLKVHTSTPPKLTSDCSVSRSLPAGARSIPHNPTEAGCFTVLTGLWGDKQYKSSALRLTCVLSTPRIGASRLRTRSMRRTSASRTKTSLPSILSKAQFLPSQLHQTSHAASSATSSLCHGKSPSKCRCLQRLTWPRLKAPSKTLQPP